MFIFVFFKGLTHMLAKRVFVNTRFQRAFYRNRGPSIDYILFMRYYIRITFGLNQKN